MEDERRNTGFRLHHEAFGKLNADLFRLQQAEQAGLLLKLGAGRITERIALAAIARLKQRLARQIIGVGKSPQPAQAPEYSNSGSRS